MTDRVDKLTREAAEAIFPQQSCPHERVPGCLEWLECEGCQDKSNIKSAIAALRPHIAVLVEDLERTESECFEEHRRAEEAEAQLSEYHAIQRLPWDTSLHPTLLEAVMGLQFRFLAAQRAQADAEAQLAAMTAERDELYASSSLVDDQLATLTKERDQLSTNLEILRDHIRVLSKSEGGESL